MKKVRLLILVPAFNEEKMIAKVIDTLPKKISQVSVVDTLVVNDGSTDGTENEILNKKVALISHLINRGLGGALGTGFDYARKNNYDLVVTFDADGQHNPKDISRIIEPILRSDADVVIGSRLLVRVSMPFFRYLVNVISNIATLLLFNIMTSDSQSGLRAFSKKAVHTLTIKAQGMEVSSEIFREIKYKRLRKKEIPINAVYTEYSLKKGQRLSNAPDVFWKLLVHSFRFS